MIQTIKLKEYNSETLKKTSFGAYISIGKDGTFKFNVIACGLLGLRQGDKVSLFQSETEKSDWYVTKSENGFKLRSPSVMYNNLEFGNIRLAKLIFNSLGVEPTKGRITIGEKIKMEDRELFTLITKSLIK